MTGVDTVDDVPLGVSVDVDPDDDGGDAFAVSAMISPPGDGHLVSGSVVLPVDADPDQIADALVRVVHGVAHTYGGDVPLALARRLLLGR